MTTKHRRALVEGGDVHAKALLEDQERESKVPASAIREWAAGQGIEVPAIGPVPLKVVEQYEEAHA